VGLLWGRVVTAANVSDQEGFRQVVVASVVSLVQLVKIFVDRGYRGDIWQWLLCVTGGQCQLEVVLPKEGQVGFAVQAKRWIVERTIAWLSWSRRLSKDYEQTITSSQTWMDVSAIRWTLRKLLKNEKQAQ
jgi:putative transposase